MATLGGLMSSEPLVDCFGWNSVFGVLQLPTIPAWPLHTVMAPACNSLSVPRERGAVGDASAQPPPLLKSAHGTHSVS
jgi:hypothetical protein